MDSLIERRVGIHRMESVVFVPPSGLHPYAMAIASSSVDFPDPFSPVKNVI